MEGTKHSILEVDEAMRPKRIDNLTGVRGFAALWVVVFHARGIGGSLHGLGRIIDHGPLGVDLFFVLSGFVLSLVYAPQLPGKFSKGWFSVFILRRFAKIYPLHLLTLLFSIAIYVVSLYSGYHFLSFVDNTWWTALCQLLLLHAFGLTRQISWNTVSWSVSAEWFAYTVLFAPMSFLLRGIRIVWIFLLVTAAWLLLVLLGIYVFHQGISLETFGILRITPEFMGGYLLYRMLGEVRPVRGDLWTIAGILLLLATCFLDNGFAIFVLPALLILVAGLYAGGRLTNWVFGNWIAIVVGEASYSIYLIQVYPAIALNQVLRRFHVGLVGWRFDGIVVLLTGLTTIIGLAVFRFIEEPLRQAILRRFGPRSPDTKNVSPKSPEGAVPDTQVAATIG